MPATTLLRCDVLLLRLGTPWNLILVELCHKATVRASMLLSKHLQVLGRHGILMLDHANGLGRMRLVDLGSVRVALGRGLVICTVLVGS